MATSKIKSDSIDSIDAVKITTGTVDNARITLDAAEVPNLDASKITTGSIADARVPSSAVTQHSDTSSIENDISILALQNAINGNMTAHGLSNYWIEQFEDSDSITALTNASRNSSEYVTSSSATTPAYVTGNRSSTITVTSDLTNAGNGTAPNLVDGTNGNNATNGWRPYDSQAMTGKYVRFDWGSGNSRLITEAKFYEPGNTYAHGLWKWQGSNDASSWTDIGSGFTLGVDSSTSLHTITELSGNTSAYRYYQMYGISGNIGTSYWGEMEFKEGTITWNATGSFTSTTITPQDSASKSSLGLCLLYKNNTGTNTLNTDIIAKVSADNGSNYSTCVLASKGTFSTGINIAIAPALSVTSGNQLKYKIEFANQAASVAGGYQSGDRSSSITVTTTISEATGTVAKLVDGNAPTNNSHGAGNAFYWANGSNNVAGQEVKFQWASGQTITGAKMLSAGSDSQGTWKWQGSNNGSSWTDIGANFAFDTASSLTFDTNFGSQLSGNSTAYTYYRMYGVSGSTNGSTWFIEIEFYHAAVAGKEAQIHGIALQY